MQSHFSADFFTANRRKLRQQASSNGPIVLSANGLLQRNGDVTYPFRQDSNFWYLTGVNEPDLVLVIDNNEEYLLVPERGATRTTFDGAVDVAELRNRSGVAEILPYKEGWRKLVGRLGKTKQAATVLPLATYDKRHGIYQNPAPKSLVVRMKRAVPNITLEDVRSPLELVRMIKQPAELAAIRSAIDITTETIDSLRGSTLAKFQHEYQLEAAITAGFRSRGAAGHAFEPIVANGKRACVLHNVANEGALNSSQLTVVDVGAEVEHYAADITRTLAVHKPSKRQAAVHAAVLAAQDFAFKQLKPGVLSVDYERAVAVFIGQKLQELGLIRDIDGPSVRRYFPHATSHFLGLDVHDEGDYSRPLEPGMVLTVEPGIYIPEEGIGVRIEDDVIITENGIEILSQSCPRELF